MKISSLIHSYHKKLRNPTQAGIAASSWISPASQWKILSIPSIFLSRYHYKTSSKSHYRNLCPFPCPCPCPSPCPAPAPAPTPAPAFAPAPTPAPATYFLGVG